MPKVTLNVKLLEVTQNALSLIYAACRQCYSAKFAADIFQAGKEDQKKQSEFVKKVVASGHESPLEHVKFTFAVEGVSRALTHQLVRHRLASYSQQSQRYVKESDFSYIIPPSIESDEQMKQEFLRTMRLIQDCYNKMQDHFSQKGVFGEKANQDIRFLLPQAAETKIVVTMNTRELIHFFKLRCCTRAQWEIKAMADEMLKICKKELPEVFDNAGSKCEEHKFCPEGDKFTCGRYPTKDKVLK